MPTHNNVYAPPASPLYPQPTGAIWRDGKTLCMEHGASLPARCVKCNARAEQPGKPKKVYWHHPALYVLVLFWVILYIIVAIIVRKTATINPSLCPLHKKRRIIGLTVGWLGSLTGLAMAFAFAAMDSCGLAFSGIAVLLGAIITGMVLARVLYPSHIDNHLIQLQGCGKAFLDSLPDRRA